MPKKLGAATDDPVALAKRALRKSHEAEESADDIDAREAANLGWLAVCSLADVASERLGETRGRRGSKGREQVIADLEKEAGIRRGTLGAVFAMAQSVLHGDTFHEDKPLRPAVRTALLEQVLEGMETGMRAIGKIGKRR
jgi:hypothetical protein